MKASAGLDNYVILQPASTLFGTQTNAQWQLIYLGNSAVRSVGAYNSTEAALNAANVDFNGLPT